MEVRKAIEVSGVVQGVGFRPFVYRLAHEQGLQGSVCNTSAGVAIEVQGPSNRVEAFLVRLPQEAPPLARIAAIEVEELPLERGGGFEILGSRSEEPSAPAVPPDVAVCDDCLREMRDPRNRRYRYPFINCTNCGPRFTIVRSLPYDRPSTSMASFRMCAACAREYEDPADRRFHAQPTCCWDCGPRVALWTSEGDVLEGDDPVEEAARHLKEGAVVAVKGLGGFHLAADALNEAAVERLRRRKLRWEKPFAVMTAGLDPLSRFVTLDAAARALILSPERPVVLVPMRWPNPVAPSVAPRQRRLGVFLPYTPLHHLLFEAGGFTALVMTSANRSEEPIVIGNREAVARLRGLADFLLVHDRDIAERCDDSVAAVVAGRPRPWRRSRGWVPVPVRLPRATPPILAVGGELKSTLCLTRGREAFLSQHLGDLENEEAFRFFEDSIAHWTGILEMTPEVIAHDLHPGYLSTQWARARDTPRVEVQHHHAHVAACMAEHALEGRVIGIALDGAGYGPDGTIWGGEVLLADARGYERAAHLETVGMPGGEQAARQPWRMGVSYLHQAMGSEALALDLAWVRALDREKARRLVLMLERGIQSPRTSSCGRLFDAVSALAGLCQVSSFEGQAAGALEAAIEGDDSGPPYPLELQGGPCRVLGTGPLFRAIVEDLRGDVPAGVISRRFHAGLVEAFARTALAIGRETGLTRVCLSGGCFQNAYLLERLTARLQEGGCRVFSHVQVPSGDGGLSLGQAWVAAHRGSADETGRGAAPRRYTWIPQSRRSASPRR